MAKTVYTLTQVLGKIAGAAHYAQNGTVTFGFAVSTYATYFGATSNLNDTQKTATREAMTLWNDISNLNFAETSGSSASIKLSNVQNPSFAGGQIGDTIMLSSSYSYMLNPTMGNYGFMAIIHEVGHALGLNHPGNYNGGAPTYAANALYMQDSQQYTLMSYFAASNTGANHGGYYASTPLLHDIAALQKLYGADMTTRAGDTVYGFGSTAGRKAFDFTQNTHPIVCIWDGGGTDTLNVSGFGNDQLIDLHAGSFSNVGGLTSNVSIAYNCNIENAVGGSGNDTLIGNALNNVLTGGAGNDTLNGDTGEDRLIGGLGDDTYVINSTGDVMVEQAGQGTDTVSTTFSFTLASNFENLILAGTTALNGTGNSAANTLTGNTAANTLDGGAGADILIGGKGNDTYIVDNVGDQVRELAGQGTDTVLSSVSFTLSSDVEHLTFTGTAALNGTGNTLNNTLTGNDGANILAGGAGNDALVGGGGNDRLMGQAGVDTLTGGAGADTFIFDLLSLGTRDTIKDFSVAQRDVLNVHDLLINFASSQLASFVKLTASGSSELLAVDRDGTGSAYSFTTLALLQNMSGHTAQSLFNNGELIV